MLTPKLYVCQIMLTSGGMLFAPLTAIEPRHFALGYMEIFFNNGSMTMTFHIQKNLEVLGRQPKDGRSMNA